MVDINVKVDGRSTFDNILKVCQAGVVGGSALGAVYLYATHGKDRAVAELKAVELGHESAKLDHESAKHQHEIANLEAEERLHRLNKSKKEKLRKELIITEAMLSSFTLPDVDEIGYVNYNFSVRFDLENVSEVTTHVTAAIMDFYVGAAPRYPLLRTPSPRPGRRFSAFVVGRPPSRWNDNSYGDIEWTLVASVGGASTYLDDGSTQCPEMIEGFDDVEFRSGLLCTGPLNPGDMFRHPETVEIQMPLELMNAMVGWVAISFVTDCEKVWHIGQPVVFPMPDMSNLPEGFKFKKGRIVTAK